MANIKKYNLKGDEVGYLSIDDSLLHEVANSQMIKDYIVAYRANQRQWSANTKSRAEVNHSGQKPHPQKGTGRARQGYLGSPQYKGGGRVFGPKPKFNQHVQLNKKEKRAVIRSLMVQKILEQRVHVLSVDEMKEPKTKLIADFLKARDLSGKRVLFLGEDLFLAYERILELKLLETLNVAGEANDQADFTIELSEEEMNIIKPLESEAAAAGYQRELLVNSMRNIPKVEFSLLPNLNGYELVLHQDIILLDGSTHQLLSLLGGNK